jgi:hypothetical protein
MRTLVLGVITCLFVPPVQAKYSGGTGTADDPYQIATAADLILLGESPPDYDKHFVVTADLDLDPSLPGRKVFDKAAIAPITRTVGWLSESGTPFAGVFDGGGHTVARLAITGGDYLGLFGRLASAGEVRNLAVVDVNVVGSGDYVGGLVGLNEGRIGASYVQGEVRGDFKVGGLAGGTYGMVTACYAQVRVSGTQEVGGFVGGAGGTIVRCYATGEVIRPEGRDFFGGFAGQENASAVIKGCVWDTQTSGIGVSDCGIGFDTAELMEPDAYSLNGWAGDPNWVLAVGQDYPRLAWEGSPGQVIGEPVIDFLAGSGTSEDPYQIATPDELALLGTASILWDKALVLTADLDVNGVPIRRIGVCQGSEFRGSFDGRGHTIRNLTMDTGDLSAWWMGLFGWIHSDGRVTNLNLEHAIIKGGGVQSEGLGALAGVNWGSLSNCAATNVFVEGRSRREGTAWYLGGLTGLNEGSVDHCRVTGNVSGDMYIGGLAGINYGSIVHCRADAVVSGRRAFLGGLAGGNLGFSVLTRVGTVVTYRGTIENSCATGQVDGAEDAADVGGLVGYNEGDIAGCYATGAVSGRHLVGGLAAGNSRDATTTNSYARGDAVGGSVVGGLVAVNTGTITACYATGKATGSEHRGGLAAYSSGDTAASFWDIRTSGLSESAGGIGRTTTEMRTAKTFLDAGWDFVGEMANGTEDIWCIHEGKDYPRLWWEGCD